MAHKAARVRRALEREFHKVRQRGSHITLMGRNGPATFAYHDRVELSDRQLSKVAGDFGLTLDELKSLL